MTWNTPQQTHVYQISVCVKVEILNKVIWGRVSLGYGYVLKDSLEKEISTNCNTVCSGNSSVTLQACLGTIIIFS